MSAKADDPTDIFRSRRAVVQAASTSERRRSAGSQTVAKQEKEKGLQANGV
jgi:hypothetical protein